MKSLKLGTTVLAGAMVAFLFVFVGTSVSARTKSDRQQQEEKKKTPPPPPQKSNQSPPPRNSPPPPQRSAPPATHGGGNPPTGQRGGNPPNQQRGNPPTGQRGGNPPTGQRGGNPPNQQGGNLPTGQRGGNSPNNAANRGGTNRPPANTRQITTKSGAVAYVRPNGGVARIENHGTVITRGVHGERTVVTRLAGGGRVVTQGPRGGYVQRSFTRNNQTFVSRTYVVNNRTFVHVYQPMRFRGITYYRYVPAFYFRPAFYGWFFSPWRVGISFSWGWGPWFGFYGGYFQPYPVYTAPWFWLTDYLIAENLNLAYENQQLEAENAQYNAPPPDAGSQAAPVTLSPEVKQAIADEVQRQLAEEQNEAAQGGSAAAPPPAASGDQIPPALDPQMSTFIVTSNLEVTDNGQPCELTPGDVIVRIDDTPGPDSAVEVKVTNSKAGDCRAGARPRILVTDLQEMMNQFRAQIDSGTQQLAADQGQNGMPAAPPGSTATVQGPGQAPPDPNAANLLQQQQHDADAIESDVKKQTSSGQNNQ